jgi:hypothetical protein
MRGPPQADRRRQAVPPLGSRGVQAASIVSWVCRAFRQVGPVSGKRRSRNAIQLSLADAADQVLAEPRLRASLPRASATPRPSPAPRASARRRSRSRGRHDRSPAISTMRARCRMAKSIPPSGARLPSGRRNMVPKLRPTMPSVSPTAAAAHRSGFAPSATPRRRWNGWRPAARPPLAMSQKPLAVMWLQSTTIPARVAFADQRAARLRQSRAGVPVRAAAERHAMGEGIRPRPDRPERAQPRIVERVEPVEICADALRPFEMQHDRQRAVARRSSDRRACRAIRISPDASSAEAMSTWRETGISAAWRGIGSGSGMS